MSKTGNSTGAPPARPTRLAGAVGLVVLVGLTACSSPPASAPRDGASPRPEGDVVSVELTDAGCTADMLSAPAGTVSFHVTSSTGSVTELEVLRGTRILAERENIAAGLSADFSVDLGPGGYTLYCPGGTGPDSHPFTATGASSSSTTREGTS